MSTAGAIDAAAARTSGILWLAALLAIALWLLSGIGTVEPGNRAVVLRWGAVDRVVDAGLVLAWPRPLEAIVRIPGAERTQTTAIRRFASPSSAYAVSATSALNPDGALASPFDAAVRSISGTSGCLTGDVGLVHLSGTVVWTVDDPRAYVAATSDGTLTIVQALERTFAASAIAACARRSVDGVLVVGNVQLDDQAAEEREQLRGELVAGLNQRLRELGLGIAVQRVDLAVELPDDAKPAFAEVLSAGQAAERAIAEARALAERERQEALQARAQRLAGAEATARELTSQARVATDAIVALAQEREPQRQRLLRERMYRDSVESVLRHAGQVLIVSRRTPALVWLMQLQQQLPLPLPQRAEGAKP